MNVWDCLGISSCNVSQNQRACDFEGFITVMIIHSNEFSTDKMVKPYAYKA